MRNSGQATRVMASVERDLAPWSEARETVAVLAWNAVKRIDAATAAQEPQAIAEMIEHLQALKEGRHG